MPAKKKVSYEEWLAMKRYCVVAEIKIKSEKNPFLRVFGPFEKRSAAAAYRLKFKKKLEENMNHPLDAHVESFTIHTTTLWSKEMFGTEITTEGFADGT